MRTLPEPLRYPPGRTRISLARPARHGVPFQRAALLAPLYECDWVVYAKPPFGGPEQVLKYLARYTHRVAIANRRLLSLRNGRFRFRYKDYARRGRKRVMDLDAPEFIRRFLLHVLPKGFVHIRHFGFLANPVGRKRLARCRELLDAVAPPSSLDEGSDDDAGPQETANDNCLNCKQGRIVRQPLDPAPSLARDIRPVPVGIDSS